VSLHTLAPAKTKRTTISPKPPPPLLSLPTRQYSAPEKTNATISKTPLLRTRQRVNRGPTGPKAAARRREEQREIEREQKRREEKRRDEKREKRREEKRMERRRREEKREKKERERREKRGKRKAGVAPHLQQR
jgi:hypothetical protein